jgi:hypothetical protein
MTEYSKFRKLTDKLYPYCTTEQKLGLYIQHRPGAVVPLLLEMVLELHPEKNHEQQDPKSD